MRRASDIFVTDARPIPFHLNKLAPDVRIWVSDYSKTTESNHDRIAIAKTPSCYWLTNLPSLSS